MCWLYACLQTFCASLRSHLNHSQSRCSLVRHAFLCALAFRLVALLVSALNQDLLEPDSRRLGRNMSIKDMSQTAVRISRFSTPTPVKEENLLT